MKILKVSSKNLKEVSRIITESIRRGEVIILPTDTVYGLIADAKNEKAVKRIFKIKRRETKKTLSIFVKDIKMAKDLAFVNKRQEKFLKTSWPGKVTAVLKVKPKVKNLFKFGIINSENKIGLRIPKYKLINTLLKKLDTPLTGTSANISGNPASTKIKEVLRQFENRKEQPDLIIDAGNLPKSRPSIVLDLTKSPAEILRS
ncbi:threonylcarbamoyl-AMP synthase [Patescibacteria group bacterium]|nr:threonylcarbamoyl-AMP synthase [Patescibacteria group bacterium]MBU4481774.1 threonylcarbamoyl-AMP synthase [Patescibacteria group bacterium]